MENNRHLTFVINSLLWQRRLGTGDVINGENLNWNSAFSANCSYLRRLVIDAADAAAESTAAVPHWMQRSLILAPVACD
jgi:hypothetical protein